MRNRKFKSRASLKFMANCLLFGLNLNIYLAQIAPITSQIIGSHPFVGDPEAGLEPEVVARQSAAVGQERGKRTLYACEEKQLEIQCPAGELIHLIRANYGRFSIQICNEHGQVDWTVNCRSQSSEMLITNSCNAKQSCQLLASNSIFADSCPGTQKYLEVHYQCVPSGQLSNITGQQENGGQSPATRSRNQANGPRARQPNVIQTQQAQQEPAPGVLATSERQPLPAPTRWAAPELASARGRAPALPDWATEVPLGALPADGPRPANASCPATVWRGLAWPATPAGALAHAPCPQQPDEGQSASATLACLPDGRWAGRAEAALCQSGWLMGLARLVDAGDSPLAALAELLARTRPATPTGGPLFGGDLLMVGRVVRRLVEELEGQLNGIADDRQRLGLAREFVQSLAELISQLASGRQWEPWQDLGSASGQRRRLAGQLIASLEAAAVLYAGVEGHAQRPAGELPAEEASAVKATENVYLAVRSLMATNRSLEASFPARGSILESHWMKSDQRFSLQLKTGSGTEDSPQAAGQPLKLIFLLVRGLGGQMERQVKPLGSSKEIVNSDIVSLTIVTDQKSGLTSDRVDLSAPVELVFQHTNELAQYQQPNEQRKSPRCVYWDQAASDWLADGCELRATNSSHSICDCKHLTSFALLQQIDQPDPILGLNPMGGLQTTTITAATTISQQQQQQQHQISKLQLESIESQLFLPNNKVIHLAKLLDGQLLAERLLVFVSCLASALILGLSGAAHAYSRRHARRLLAAIPPQPAPALLVANGVRPQEPCANPLLGQLRRSLSSDSSPTYSATVDYPAALAATKSKLERESEAMGPSAGHPRAARPRVPLALTLQQLALQLLVVLLTESQNLLVQRRANFRSRATAPLELSGADQVAPLGWLSWLLCGLLYYLVISFTCWLLIRLLRLDLWLMQLAGWLPRSLASSGRCSASGCSASSSRASSSQDNKHYGHLPSSSTTQTASPPLCQLSAAAIYQQSGELHGAGYQRQPSPSSSTSCSLRRHEDRRAPAPPALGTIVERLLPVCVVCLVAWQSAGSRQQAEQLNAAAATWSLGAQAAYWPLAADLTLAQFTAILYMGSGLCLLLLCLAVCLAGRSTRGHSEPHQQIGGHLNPYGSSASFGQRPAHLANGLAKQQAHAGKTIDYCRANWQLRHFKAAKLPFTWLSLSLALHLLAWAPFFAHIRRTLANSREPDGRLLIYLFACANLLLSLLLAWGQRRHLRRACQLTGLGALLRRLCSCPPAGGRQLAEPKALRQATSNGLFLVPQAAHSDHLGLHHAHQHYTPANYAAQGTHAHLYHQLKGPQHIYDSTLTLGQAVGELQAMQLMHQNQNQSHQGQHQYQAHQLAEPPAGRLLGPPPMTLKPGGLVGGASGDFCLPLASHTLGGRRPGEAQGPLVALGQQAAHGPQSSPPAGERRPFDLGPGADAFRCPTSGAGLGSHLAAANLRQQQQLYGAGLMQQANYEEALSLAMVQHQHQHQHGGSHHFRWSSSQPMRQQRMAEEGNIYDVANYQIH